MNVLHSHSPWKTETGSAGEQPVKGYCGQAHQTMGGRGVQLASRPSGKTHRMIDLLCLKKRKDFMQTGVQGTGRGTVVRDLTREQRAQTVLLLAGEFEGDKSKPN